MNEKWKPILGYEGLYEVSDAGRVKSLPKYLGPRYRGEVILKPGYSKDGYLLVALCIDSILKTQRVHRLVLETFNGPCPEGMECNHKNGVKTDNTIENLEWTTHYANIQHSNDVLGHRHNRAPNYNNAKIKESYVIEIRQLLNKGVVQHKIGDLYGLSSQQISKIKNNQRWGHI